MKFAQKILLPLLLICLFSKIAHAEISEWKSEKNDTAKVRLLGSFYQGVDKKQNLIIGLHFKLKSGWKIYGNGSDELGLPPTLSFEGSQNYSSYQIIWPEPKLGEEKIGKETLKYYYYKDEVILPIEVIAKDPTKPVTLKLRVDYGLCKDVCIPGNAEFTLDIKTKVDSRALDEIQKFHNQQITIEDAAVPSIGKDKKPMKYSYPLLYMLLFALFGGVILNVMPCVLPVLSIKLLSVINHLNSEIKRIRFAFFSTTLGILFCFFSFAVIAMIIKLGGGVFGWGLQFQNPYFLVFLVLILGFFIANLLGIFEFTFEQVVANFLHKKISEKEKKKNIFVPNFLSGILAVMLATPCSAPLLGSALTFALTQNFLSILLIFLAIGVGFSTPYIILFLMPKLVYALPKPGKWMIKIKQLMAFFLGVTILWLLSIISGNLGMIGAIFIAISTLFFFYCLRIKSNFKRFIFISLTIATSFAAIFQFEGKAPKNPPLSDNIWLNFSEELLNNSLQEGKIVVIDITADWCLTCKFNKARVLQDEQILGALKGSNVVAMRGNITKPNKKIMDFLHKHGRFAIPFNAVYGPNAKNGLLTNELLDKKELLNLIKQAS